MLIIVYLHKEWVGLKYLVICSNFCCRNNCNSEEISTKLKENLSGSIKMNEKNEK
jgi:hypothetical protein